MKARYYDPVLGRFLNEDTYEGQVNNPLSLNVYSYCYNNPLMYRDPTGHITGVEEAIYLIYVGGAAVCVTYAYLISPEGQKAIRNGATAVHNGTVIMGKTVSITAKKTYDFVCDGFTWAKGKVVDLVNKKESSKGDTKAEDDELVKESAKAKRQKKALSPEAKKGYDKALNGLKSGDTKGLNDHPLKGPRSGQRALDIKGTGNGRGGGRIIYERGKNGKVNIVEIITGHKY